MEVPALGTRGVLPPEAQTQSRKGDSPRFRHRAPLVSRRSVVSCAYHSPLFSEVGTPRDGLDCLKGRGPQRVGGTMPLGVPRGPQRPGQAPSNCGIQSDLEKSRPVALPQT